MIYLNVRTDTLRSPDCAGLEPSALGTWLRVCAYCCEQENSGIITGAASWGDRPWMNAAGVTAAEAKACPLLKDVEGDIHVALYPREQEESVQKKRAVGKQGGIKSGRARRVANEAPGNSASFGSEAELESASQAGERKRNRKRKEKEKEKEKEEGEAERKAEGKPTTGPVPPAGAAAPPGIAPTPSPGGVITLGSGLSARGEAVGNSTAGPNLLAEVAARLGTVPTPSLEEVIAFGSGLSGDAPPECCEKWFFEHDARPRHPTGGFTDRHGTLVSNWKSSLRGFAVSWRSNEERERQRFVSRSPPRLRRAPGGPQKYEDEPL